MIHNSDRIVFHYFKSENLIFEMFHVNGPGSWQSFGLFLFFVVVGFSLVE
jgi:hypothetical protein